MKPMSVWAVHELQFVRRGTDNSAISISSCQNQTQLFILTSRETKFTAHLPQNFYLHKYLGGLNFPATVCKSTTVIIKQCFLNVG